MINLIYFSAASYLYSHKELIDLLNTCRKKNTELDITGLMIYHEGSIIQILEGEAENVLKLYEKISKDNRHKGLLKVIDARIEKRNFSNWSMGFKNVSTQDWLKITGYLNLNNMEEFKEIKDSQNKYIIKIINSFGHVNRLDNLKFCQ